MTTRQITPPAALAVPLADAKDALRIDGTDLDGQIELWVKGITASAEHELGRSLVTQSWRCTLAAFPAELLLPNAPIIAVASVKYYDADNVQQTLDPAQYMVDIESAPGVITPVCIWPRTYPRPDAVVVEYSAGYGPDATTVPDNVKTYILARLVEQFDPAARPEKDTVQSAFISRLLDACKVYA